MRLCIHSCGINHFQYFTHIAVCEEVGQSDEELPVLFTVSPAVKSLTCGAPNKPSFHTVGETPRQHGIVGNGGKNVNQGLDSLIRGCSHSLQEV